MAYYPSGMSPVWQTIIGAVAAIAGGFVGVWWQTGRAGKVARNIRRAERREDCLLTLNAKLSVTNGAFRALYNEAEHSQARSQYLRALMLIEELRQLWDGSSSGAILGQAVINAYTEFDIAVHDELPAGEPGAERQREISTGDADTGRRFVRDLGHVLGLLDDLKNEVQRQVEDLRQPDVEVRRLRLRR
jgi:hypothetical protein